ncbi:MAG: gamma-glutamyl-gamma-aminobutyrate hydrolase family protein [Nevskiales bacterium]
MKPRIAIPVPHSAKKDYVARALPPYVHAIEDAGGEAMPIPLEKTQDEIAEMLKQCHGIVLPGSPADVDPEKYGEPRHQKTNPADPLRDAADELLLQDAHNMRKPILAICYGLQALNVWRSGKLCQDIASELRTPVKHDAGRKVKEAHRVNVDPTSRLATILSDAPGTSLSPSPDFTAMQMMVNSSHHQSADVVGDGLRVVARSPEDGVIEALEGDESEGQFVLAVQWHPERSYDHDPASRALFKALVEAAEHWQQSDYAKDEPEGLQKKN